MSIASINEQLLRAVGVGIALFQGDELALTFQNEVFETWFDDSALGQPIAAILTQLDVTALKTALAERSRYSTELSLRKKRRTIVLAVVFRQTEISGEPVLVVECQNVTRIRELESMIESYSAMVERNTREIQREKEQVEKLLLNIMPRGAYEEYKSVGVVAPQTYDAVSVLVLDFANFADTMDELPPASFVGELTELYTAFDRIAEQFGCERIKTTGDRYLCIAGMTDRTEDHAKAVTDTALRFVRYLRRRNENAETKWECRVGLGTGPVIGSVVGAQNYVYDVFGEAIERAAQALRAADVFEVLAAAALASAVPEVEFGPPSRDVARDQDLMSIDFG